MSVDLTKLQFIGDYTIDRVAGYETLNTTGSTAVTLPSGSSTDGTTYSTTLTNLSGVAGPINLTYSLDNVNFVPAATIGYYYNGTFLEYLIDISAYAACTDDTVYLFFYTQNPASKVVYVNLAREVF